MYFSSGHVKYSEFNSQFVSVSKTELCCALLLKEHLAHECPASIATLGLDAVDSGPGDMQDSCMPMLLRGVVSFIPAASLGHLEEQNAFHSHAWPARKA